MEKMLQAYMPKAKTIEFREVDKPSPRPNEVLMRVSKIGICGSDLHVFEGKHPLVSFPLVQGHEFSGYVESTGADVTGFDPGDIVVVEPAIGCGACKKCKAGLIAQCDNLQFIGGALHGGGSEFFAVDAAHVIKLKRHVRPEDAAMIEPLAVAVHNIGRAADVAGKSVIIIGAGTIGNLTAQVALIAGAKQVRIFDINPKRIEIAKICGLDAYHIDELKALYGSEKAEISFECVGREKALNDCIDFTERGGTIVVPGVYSGDPAVKMVQVQDCELNVLGSLMYTWADYDQSVKYVEEAQVMLKPLQTYILPFKQWLDGYHLLENPESGALKVIIDLDENPVI